MVKYELVIVLPGSMEEEELTTLSKKIKGIVKNTGAKLEKETDWGVKKLTYPIRKQEMGHYFLWQIELPQNKIKEMQRLLNFEEELLRYMLLKV